MNRKQLRRMIMSAINEHRVAPSLNLPGVPQSHVDKIHALIDAGELEQAQSLIDAFGGDPNYAENYRAYEEVGDLEKLGNKAADVYHSLPKGEYGWASPDDLSQVYAIDREAYRLGIDKVARGTMPVQPGDVSGAHPHHAHMRDRYYNNRNSIPVDFDEGGNPLNEGRKALRRMILQELFLFSGAKEPSKYGHMNHEFAKSLRLHARSYPGSYIEVGIDDYGVTISSSMNAFDPVTLQVMLDDGNRLLINGPGGLSGRFNNPYEAAEIILFRLLGGY